MTWMRTFTTKNVCCAKADTEAGVFEIVMSMMSYDAWGVPQPSLMGMKWAYKKWVWRQEHCLFVVIRTVSQIIHQVAFTRSIGHDHR